MSRSDPPIRFGTSGWRGILGEDFRFDRLRAVATAVARWTREQGGERVVVGHDTRLLADRAADVVARVLHGAGLATVRPPGPVPTPVVCHAVRRRRAAAGVVLTASHNPPEYLGLKLVAPWGGAAPRAVTDRLEVLAARALRSGPPVEGSAAGSRGDLSAAYRRDLLRHLDRAAFARARVSVVYDALHGTGAGVMDRLLEQTGARVERLRAEPDPRFGGAPPDPVPERLGGLASRVRRIRGRRLGLATDGDADRYGAVDADGRVLGESEVLALLVDHLARSGRIRRGVAISSATGSLVERVARHHGLRVTRHPIGFKHLTRELRRGAADVAGEESGGFAWSPVSVDKDGMLAGCLLAERVARDGAPLSAGLRALERRLGASRSGRRALPARTGSRAALAALRRSPPRHFDGARVQAVDRSEGLRLALSDGFVLWRASGTEPVLRVYAEAPGAEALARRLERAGARLAAGRRGTR